MLTSHMHDTPFIPAGLIVEIWSLFEEVYDPNSKECLRSDTFSNALRSLDSSSFTMEEVRQLFRFHYSRSDIPNPIPSSRTCRYQVKYEEACEVIDSLMNENNDLKDAIEQLHGKVKDKERQIKKLSIKEAELTKELDALLKECDQLMSQSSRPSRISKRYIGTSMDHRPNSFAELGHAFTSFQALSTKKLDQILESFDGIQSRLIDAMIGQTSLESKCDELLKFCTLLGEVWNLGNSRPGVAWPNFSRQRSNDPSTSIIAYRTYNRAPSPISRTRLQALVPGLDLFNAEPTRMDTIVLGSCPNAIEQIRSNMVNVEAYEISTAVYPSYFSDLSGLNTLRLFPGRINFISSDMSSSTQFQSDQTPIMVVSRFQLSFLDSTITSEVGSSSYRLSQIQVGAENRVIVLAWDPAHEALDSSPENREGFLSNRCTAHPRIEYNDGWFQESIPGEWTESAENISLWKVCMAAGIILIIISLTRILGHTTHETHLMEGFEVQEDSLASLLYQLIFESS